MRKQNHTHKFKRHTYNTGNSVFFCILPDCSFKVDTALTLGKKSICNRCGKEFSIDEYSIRLAKPHCRSCGKKRVKIDGQTRYVRPIDIVADSLAEDRIDSLQNRLNNLSSDVVKPDIIEDEI